MQKDARAVENPISAIFELSEDVVKQAPAIKSLGRYATAFIGIWLFIDLILILATLAAGQLFLFIITTALFIIGIVSIILMRRINRFFKYYVARHRSIKAVREMDPMVYAPKGNNAPERFVGYLRTHSEEMKGQRVEISMPGILPGRHGRDYKFDIYIKEQPGFLWRAFGFGRHGFSIFVKHFPQKPTGKQIQSFKEAVEDVTARTKIPPSRIVALWERREGDVLDDNVYQYIMKRPVKSKHRFRKLVCNLELVSETDGSYDFIPHMSNFR